jgi:membrane dipeptidase
VGMLVDGSHCGYRTTMDAMELSRQPFIFSHANARGVYDHYRNVRDDQILACARTGGVIGITGVGAFLSESGLATPELIFRHVDYVASLAGPEHVGFGLDFITHVEVFAARVAQTEGQWPANRGQKTRFEHFAPPDVLFPVCVLMMRHGYTSATIDGILGSNFLRVFGQVVG